MRKTPQNMLYYTFQSTLPCGERLDGSVLSSCGYSFNPRSRAGSDSRGSLTTSYDKMFQSTLPCGERLFKLKSLYSKEQEEIFANLSIVLLSQRGFLYIIFTVSFVFNCQRACYKKYAKRPGNELMLLVRANTLKLSEAPPINQ